MFLGVMFLKALTKAAALFCALPLCFTPLVSTDASAFYACAQSHNSTAATDSDRFERGRRLLNEGDAKGAAAELKLVAEGRKTDADAWYLFGVALSRSGDNKEARKAFEKSLKLRPSDAATHAALAYALLTLGKISDAAIEARSALALDARIAEAHYVVGAALYRDGKFKEAFDEAEAALRIKPKLGAAAYLAADSLMSFYFDESERQAALHPAPPYALDEQRRAAYAERESALEPIRARMREAANRLDALADAQPSNPDAALWREQAGSMRVYGRAEGDRGSEAFRLSEVSERAVILSKPEPGYTGDAASNYTTGIVRLRAVLAADGRVRNIAVLRSLPDGLTELCVRAARRIRFKPAVKDGHPVSQYVTLEYNFR
jgi:TonB family protein